MAEHTLLTYGPPRTFALVLNTGDAVTDAIVDFAERKDIEAASITAIGAIREATVGFFDLEAKEYHEIPVPEQAEVLSLVGDLARDEEGNVALHAHVVLGLRDGTTRGGHLLSATTRPTLEVMVTESPARLRRRYREDLGLALIDLDGPDEHHHDDPLRHGLAP